MRTIYLKGRAFFDVDGQPVVPEVGDTLDGYGLVTHYSVEAGGNGWTLTTSKPLRKRVAALYVLLFFVVVSVLVLCVKFAPELLKGACDAG